MSFCASTCSGCFSDSLCSIFRGYLHAAIGISSCLWPPGVLIDHDDSFDSLCPTPYYQLCTPETTSIATHLVRYSAVCTSTCPAHSSGSHLVFQLYKRGISFILSPYAESSAIIDLIGQVGISWCYVVAWPDLPQSAFNDPNGPIAGSTYCARPSTFDVMYLKFTCVSCIK